MELQEVGGDAASDIRVRSELERGLAGLLSQRQGETSIGSRQLHRIGQDIPDNLRRAIRIAAQAYGTREGGRQGDFLRVGGGFPPPAYERCIKD